MKNHGFKSVFEVCAALLAQYIAFYMISSRLGKEAEIENFLTNKFVMIFWVIYLTNKSYDRRKQRSRQAKNAKATAINFALIASGWLLLYLKCSILFSVSAPIPICIYTDKRPSQQEYHDN